MIRKSGYRFSEQDHAPTKNLDHDPIQSERIMVWCPSIRQERTEVLQRLSDHIRFCHERAVQAEERTAQAEESEKSRNLLLAQWWAHLARSYEFTESLERFLVEFEAEGKARRERLDQQAPLDEQTPLDQQAPWARVATAPYDRDLRLAVIDGDGVAHELVFPCRRILGGWVKSQTKDRLHIDPTHWQEWSEQR